MTTDEALNLVHQLEIHTRIELKAWRKYEKRRTRAAYKAWDSAMEDVVNARRNLLTRLIAQP